MELQPRRRGAERRAAFRVPVCLPVMLEGEAFSQGFVCKDLSTSGIYLIGELDGSLGLGTSGLSLELHLPGGLGVLRAGVAVVRLQQDTPRGLGFAWTRLGAGERGQLEELARRWRAAFPGDSTGA